MAESECICDRRLAFFGRFRLQRFRECAPLQLEQVAAFERIKMLVGLLPGAST